MKERGSAINYGNVTDAINAVKTPAIDNASYPGVNSSRENALGKRGKVADLRGNVLSDAEISANYGDLKPPRSVTLRQAGQTEHLVPVGVVNALPNGDTVSTVVPGSEYDKIPAPKVAHHEADHAGVDDGDTELMTIIPSGNARGLTIPGTRNRYSFAKAALAAHLNGHEGTSHDLMVARMTGVDLKAAANDARADLDRTAHRRRALAGAVTIHGTLLKDQIRWVKRNADERKADNENGVTPVTIYRKTGEKVVFKAPKVNGAAYIPQSHLKAAA